MQKASIIITSQVLWLLNDINGTESNQKNINWNINT